MNHSRSSIISQPVRVPLPSVRTPAARPQLVEDDSHFREAFTKAPIGMAVVSPNGQWLQVNAAMCQIVGYTADELYQLTFQDLTHPDDLLIDLAYVEQIIAGDISAYQMEKRYFHKDGQIVWVLLSVTLVRYPDGMPRYFMSQVQDVTALKQANIALSESEERFRQLVEGAHDYALLMLTPEGFIASWNSGAARLKGYTTEAILGKPFSCFYTAADQARDLPGQLLARALAEGHVTDEGWRVRSDGSQFWATVVITALYDAAGKHRGFSKLTRDATERRLVEQALQREQTLLEQRVDERTAELRLANDELARLVRLKDEFLAGMSHELRTPLNAILGRGELLRDEFYGPLNGRQQAAITTIEESGHHLLALINDILDLAKMRSGQIELEQDTVDISSLCASVVRMIAQTAVLKRIAVHHQIDPAVEYVQGDARRIKQILINLLSNAAKFTDANGQIGITVQGDIEREAVSFVVWDTGIGIAPEDLPRLFQPFVQLDGRLSRQYNGTGLGLALVRQIAEAHGGTIAVESTLGHGSRFRVTLPWRIPSAAPQMNATLLPAIAQARPIAEQAHAPLFGTPVLVAEDNEANSTLVCDYLHSLGYRVQLARDGAEAVVRAIELRPAIILMDIQLPEVDGLEAIRQIRAEPALAATPIIALTALAMPGDRERCLEAGADEYASKPLGLITLHTLMMTHLERTGRISAAPATSM